MNESVELPYQGLSWIFCHGPKPEHELDNDWADKYYIPGRVHSLVRPGLDHIVLPAGRSELEEFSAFCGKVLGLKSDQVLWTTGKDYLLDHGIQRELMPAMHRIVTERDSVLVPYCVTGPFHGWGPSLKVPIIGDSEDWARRHADKAILHPNAIPKNRDVGTPLLRGVNVPKGFACENVEELMLAARLLKEQGVGELILKPRFSTAGEGMIKGVNAEQMEKYDFPMGGVVLEQCLKFEGVSSIQFLANHLLPCPTDQLVKDCVFMGNIVPSRKPARFQSELMHMAQEIVDQLGPKGLGALDFLEVENRPVFIDPNLGRWTGGWIGRRFHQMYAPKSCYQSWKLPSKVNDGNIPSVFQFWEKLNSKGLAFNPQKPRTGIFPLCYLPKMWSMLVAVGQSPAEVDRLYDKAMECLAA